MITLVHGGQTGVDRGAHEAALINGWAIAGFMPIDCRDERGRIPDDVARFLIPHDKPGYGARTEANVRSANAALIIVRDAAEAHTTPGTAMTIELVIDRRLPRRVVDPTYDATAIASWLWNDLLAPRAPMLPLLGFSAPPAPNRLLVAGPRESKWPEARAETTGLLGRIAASLVEIARDSQNQDLARRGR
jgi:hypothetical protein